MRSTKQAKVSYVRDGQKAIIKIGSTIAIAALVLVSGFSISGSLSGGQSAAYGAFIAQAANGSGNGYGGSGGSGSGDGGGAGGGNSGGGVSAAESGGDTGGDTGLGNNLSVPTIFLTGGTPPVARIAYPSVAVSPGTDGQSPSTEYSGYWLQATDATWTAETTTDSVSATVTADWGDNLTGDRPSLPASRPYRVEVGLLDTAAAMTGYMVHNLTPELEDRYAIYGTKGDPDDTFLTPYAYTNDEGAAATLYTRVWDPGATLTIEKMDGSTVTSTLFDGPATAEINSTGNVVYGYNWTSTDEAGTYRLTFTASSAVTIDAVADEGPVFTPNSTSVTITLVAGSGDGGGGGGGGGGEETPSAPTITAIEPATGYDAGGTDVTITGTGFVTGTTVNIGGIEATDIVIVNETTITAKTPAHDVGVADVAVTNTNGSGSLTGAFTYEMSPIPLTAGSISPASGSSQGGIAITITGTGFVEGAKVTIGGVDATDVVVVNDTAITAKTPTHDAGKADVIVTNPDDSSATISQGFEFMSSSSGDNPPSGGGGGSSGGGGGGGASWGGWAFTQTNNNQNQQGQVLGGKTWAEGTLVKVEGDPTVYMSVNNELRPFTTGSAFMARGLNFSDVQTISADDLASAKIGKVMGYPDGTLVKGSDSTVYVIFNGAKHGIPSMDVFTRLGYTPDQITQLPDGDIAAHDDGGVVS